MFGAALLFLIGIGLIVSAITWTMDIHEFISRAKTADGVVIVTTHAASHPRIEYTEASGAKRWFFANDGISGYRISGYKDGEHVRLFYDPADPARTHIDNFGYLYTVPITVVIIAFIFFIMGVVVLFKTTIQTKDVISALVLFLIGSGFITVTIVQAKNARVFISKANVTDGVVIALPYNSGNHADIEYTNATGEKRSFHANGHIKNYKVGEHVRVLYDPAEPTDDRIADFGFLYSCFYFEGITGVGIFVMAILAVFGIGEWRASRY